MKFTTAFTKLAIIASLASFSTPIEGRPFTNGIGSRRANIPSRSHDYHKVNFTFEGPSEKDLHHISVNVKSFDVCIPIQDIFDIFGGEIRPTAAHVSDPSITATLFESSDCGDNFAHISAKGIKFIETYLKHVKGIKIH